MGDNEKFKIKYALTPQEREDYCLCSILQAILERHGIKVSQSEIAKDLTPSKNGFLVYDERMKDFLELKGFEYLFYWHDETPFNERDTVLEEMRANNGIIGVGKHVYLLEVFEYPVVKMIDPENGQVRVRNLVEMVKEMQDSEGFFGVVKKVK